MNGKQYAILRVDKIRTWGDMNHRYNHNMRIVDVENADASLSYLNYDAQDNLNGMTYSDAFYRTMTDLKIRGTMNSPRKNAVRGLEVVLRYSREAEANIDKDAWVRKNVEWLNKTFNPPGGMMRYTDSDGKVCEESTDNVRSVMVHNDEGGTHIHAFVIPIDEKGHLNASYYLENPRALTDMQNDYAENMAEFGLSRGEYRSIATPEKIRKYYENINRAVGAELPDTLPGETAEAYRERANEEYQAAACHHRDEIVKMNQRIVQANSRTAVVRDELGKERERTKRAEKSLAGITGKESPGPDDIREIKSIVRDYRDFLEAVQSCPDKDLAGRTMEGYNQLLEWERERRRKQRRKKEDIRNLD